MCNVPTPSRAAVLHMLTGRHRKHKVRHDLLFACSTCDKGFGSKSDRDRHQATVHSQDSSQLFYCTEAGCRRPDRGFTRKDNFLKHLQNVHGLGATTDNTSRNASPGLPASGPRGPGGEHAEAKNGDARRAESEFQALEEKVRELGDKVDVLYRESREREAEARRQREREVENARLFELLGQVASRGGPQAGAQKGAGGC